MRAPTPSCAPRSSTTAATRSPRPRPISRQRGSPCASMDERSEEHTSALQSQSNLVCRLLLEKTKSQEQTHDAPLASAILDSARIAPHESYSVAIHIDTYRCARRVRSRANSAVQPDIYLVRCD